MVREPESSGSRVAAGTVTREINTSMRIDEVTNPLNTFLAKVRANGLTGRTTVQADTLSQARAILIHLFGSANVLSVTQITSATNEAATIKPQTPDQLRVKSLADQAAHLKQQEKQAIEISYNGLN